MIAIPLTIPSVTPDADDCQAMETLAALAGDLNLNITGATVRRSSSRFCLGVEHGDYNGTELFGVGTDRFIWLAAKPNTSGTVRMASANFPDHGIVTYTPGKIPAPGSCEHTALADRWGRFALGVDYILRDEGFDTSCGMDVVLYGNIPGGGMSRSASLTLNLILTVLAANGITDVDPFEIVRMAQRVENDYIGSPCGNLDQIMILFARHGMGTHYRPADNAIDYVPLGPNTEDFRIVVLDTGTKRAGLEKSTYKIRRTECDDFAALLRTDGLIDGPLGTITEAALFNTIQTRYAASHPNHCRRLSYLFHARQRFDTMLSAWKSGDMAAVGAVFRADGIGLRDDYAISGPELETMVDIARTVEGVYGERMLGGGDKGASGALAHASAVEPLQQAVATGYPRSHPDYADTWAVHTCKPVAGMVTLSF